MALWDNKYGVIKLTMSTKTEIKAKNHSQCSAVLLRDLISAGTF
jgi:hypothetical protein